MNQSIQTNQLNPYAIQLCTLGRWIAQRQWQPAGSGLFSVRTSEHSALFTCTGKDKSELSPADLISYDWSNTTEQQTAAAIHQFLYQRNPQHKVVLHINSLQATVFSRLIRTNHHLFVGYEVQSQVATSAEQSTSCPLVVVDQQTTDLMLLELHQHFEHNELPYAFLVRGSGLYVWGDSVDSAKRHLETWQFLIACELEQTKAGCHLK